MRALATWKAGKGLLKEPSSAACGKRLHFGEEQSISRILSSSLSYLIMMGKEKALPKTKLATANFSEAVAGLKEIGIS